MEISKISLTYHGISLRPLKAKHRMFVIELFDAKFDQTEAAKRCGYKNPQVAGSRLMEHPQIKRIIEKIQRKIGREVDLNLENVLKELSKAVFRDIRDLVDENGNPIRNLNKLPKDIVSAIDSVQEKIRYDKNGNVVSKNMEYRLVPKASALDMALKVTGAYAPEKHEHAMSIDWDQLLEPPEGTDSVEQELDKLDSGQEDLEAEYEVEGISGSENSDNDTEDE